MSCPLVNAFAKLKLADVNFTRTGKLVNIASTFVWSIVIGFLKSQPMSQGCYVNLTSAAVPLPETTVFAKLPAPKSISVV
jgi:hypothetical protein